MSKTTQPTVIATCIRISETELDQIKPGTSLYKQAVGALEESRQGWTYIQRADALYGDDGEIEIDDDAAVSMSEDGAYVRMAVEDPGDAVRLDGLMEGLDVRVVPLVLQDEVVGDR